MRMRDYLGEVQWEEEIRGKTVQDMMDLVIQKCQEAEERFIPTVKGKNKKEYNNPWFNRQCQEAKMASRREWRKYRRQRTEDNRSRYNRARNDYINIRRTSERDYENDIAIKAKKQPKLLHSHIRRKMSVNDQVTRLRKTEGAYTESDKEICEALNASFHGVFTTEPEQLPLLEGVTLDERLSDIEVTAEEVMKQLTTLDATKAVGPDKVSPWILKEAAQALSVPLAMIFNESLMSGELPSCWKKANVVPIFKKGDREEALNYRPVSLTSIPCKILERIIRLRLVAHLENIRFVNKHQHGFWTGKSCLTNLLEFYDKITRIRQDRDGWADCIFLDCQKAFDTVPHMRLLFKLERQAGVGGKVLAWIRNYLTGRSQRVTVRGEKSDWRTVTSGVPQGSVLGPILFLVYVNDMFTGVESYMSMFADDAKLMRRVVTDEDCRILQEDLNRLQRWSEKWLLEFNTSKCKVMEMGLGDRRPKGQYTMKGNSLPVTTRERDLGVDVTPNLSPEAHINRITTAAYSTLAKVRTSFRNLSKEAFRALYTAYVRPVLEYAASSWSPHLKKHIMKLEKVQRFATRLVPELRGMGYEERLRELCLTTLERRRERGDMIGTYKILRGIDRVDIDEMFTRNSNRTRGHGWKLETQMSHRDVRKFSFSVRVVGKWNALQEQVVEANTIHNFKTRYDREMGQESLL
jgi:hypothetical protein